MAHLGPLGTLFGTRTVDPDLGRSQMRGVRVGKTRLTTDSRAHDRQQKLTADRQQKLTADIRSSQQTTEAHNRHGEAHKRQQKLTGQTWRSSQLPFALRTGLTEAQEPPKDMGTLKVLRSHWESRAPQVAKIYNGKLPHNHESKMNPVSHEMPFKFLKP